MLLSNKKVKKNSDIEYMELDGKHNLKWNRNLNSIALPLQNVKVVTHLNTHDKEWDFDNEFKNTPEKQIKADIKTSFIITAQVNEDEMRDNIYCLEESDNNDEFNIVRPSGQIIVNLRAGKPAQEDHKKLNAGSYYGSCFRMNFDPDEDDIIFEMYMPEEQLQTIVTRVKADNNAKIEVFSEFISFTFEVEDSLREHYHSRDFVINDRSNAFVSSIAVTSNVGNHTIKKTIDDDEDDYLYEEQPEMTAEQLSHQQLLQVISNLQLPLRSTTTAIWVLALAVIISAFI